MAGGVAPRSGVDGAAASGDGTLAGGGGDWRIAMGFVAVGLAMRLAGHVNSGLWYDEIWTLVDYIRLPGDALLTTYGSDNNHPLFSLLAWVSTRALGESAFSLRLPAILFGAASLGMMYRLARVVTDRREALLATGLLLISYHHVWFSQNARGYTILLFCTLASTFHFLRCVRVSGVRDPSRRDPGGDRRNRDMVLQGFWLAVGTFAHVSAVFIAFGQLGAYAYWRWTQRGVPGPGRDGFGRYRPLLGVAIGGALSLAMHAGILGELIDYFTQHDEAAAPAVEGESEWHSPWWTVKAVAESLGFGVGPGLLGIAGGAIVITLGGLSYLRRAPVATLAFFLPLSSALAVLLLGRSLRPRFLFFEAGFFLLLIVRGLFVTAGGLAKVAPKDKRASVTSGLGWTASVAAVGVFLMMLPRAFLLPKQDFEGAMAYAQTLQSSESVVMTLGLSILPYRDYYQTTFMPIESAADFERAVSGKARAYAIHTIPVYLDAFEPDLSAVLHGRAKELKRFAGSMGDGDVIVYEIGPDSAAKGERP